MSLRRVRMMMRMKRAIKRGNPKAEKRKGKTRTTKMRIKSLGRSSMN